MQRKRRVIPQGPGALLATAAVVALGGMIAASRADQATPSLSYFDGLRAGIAEGRQEGRALQLAQMLPSGGTQPVQTAFNAGYAAGWNDVFAGYDGGWAVGLPYLVTLENGTGPITYRIGNRTPLQPGVDYYLCANGRDLCQRAPTPSGS